MKFYSLNYCIEKEKFYVTINRILTALCSNDMLINFFKYKKPLGQFEEIKIVSLLVFDSIQIFIFFIIYSYFPQLLLAAKLDS